MRIGHFITEIAAIVLAIIVAASCGGSGGNAAPVKGIHKIRHVVVIMQENRSFDSYFGTYPGADGLLLVRGKRTACVPFPNSRSCSKPYPDHHDVNYGGPHSAQAANVDTACLLYTSPSPRDS